VRLSLCKTCYDWLKQTIGYASVIFIAQMQNAQTKTYTDKTHANKNHDHLQDALKKNKTL